MNSIEKRPPTLDELRARRQEILALAARYHADRVRIFGSVARGEQTPESDIDFLVDFRDGATIWDAVGLWRTLGELLNHPVNVVGEESPNDSFMQNALKDSVPL